MVKKIGVYKTCDNIQVEGVNSKDQLFHLEMELRKRVNVDFMKEGVLLRGKIFLLSLVLKLEEILKYFLEQGFLEILLSEKGA